MTDDPKRNPDGTMKKGFSANPAGRPARSRNLITIFNEKRDELVYVNDGNGNRVRMPRLDAWVTNLWNRAIALDAKASAQVLTLMRASGQLTPAPEGDDALDPSSGAVLDALVARLADQSKP
jgi:hypothetical protein